MQPIASYALTVKSAVVRSEKPNKGVEAIPAPNPNQMNRVKGFFSDGKQVVIAQRPGKGGMDFNKIMGGKVYAVAADGISPVYEKDKDGKPTKVQKLEDGLPLYSASGFYSLSSKEYLALDIYSAYTRLREKGHLLLTLTEEQVKSAQTLDVESEFEMELLESSLNELLSDTHSLVTKYDADANRKRDRGVRRAKEEAEDANETFTGTAFKELEASKKDGKPFVLLSTRIGGEVVSEMVLRQVDSVEGDSGRVVTRYFTPEEALEHLKTSACWRQIETALAAGQSLKVGMAQGFVMRTSVSFRRKVENLLSGVSNSQYGDAVYIKGALEGEGWCKAIVTLMHSMHPNFPQADYDVHHYVASPRQAEVGMNKREPSGWTPPVAQQYDLAARICA